MRIVFTGNARSQGRVWPLLGLMFAGDVHATSPAHTKRGERARKRGGGAGFETLASLAPQPARAATWGTAVAAAYAYPTSGLRVVSSGKSVKSRSAVHSSSTP